MLLCRIEVEPESYSELSSTLNTAQHIQKFVDWCGGGRINVNVRCVEGKTQKG